MDNNQKRLVHFFSGLTIEECKRLLDILPTIIPTLEEYLLSRIEPITLDEYFSSLPDRFDG